MMKYKEEDERKIIHGHSSGGSVNNPSIQQQQAAGVELTGRVTDPDDLPVKIKIKLHSKYFDTREKITVVPTAFYDDKVMIRDGRSCSVEYAKNYWEIV